MAKIGKHQNVKNWKAPECESYIYLHLHGSACPEGEAGELGGGEGGGAVVGAPPKGSSPMVITID